MNERLFNLLIIISFISGLIGLLSGLAAFFYQFRLIFYLMKTKNNKVRKLSRVYNPFNSINFIIYVFNNEDLEDENISNYKIKLRRFILTFIVSLVIFGLSLSINTI